MPCLLQETKSDPHNEVKWQKEWHVDIVVFNSAPKKSRAAKGVAILINHPAINFREYELDVESRLITAVIEAQGQKIKIVNVGLYAPNVEHNKRK